MTEDERAQAAKPLRNAWNFEINTS